MVGSIRFYPRPGFESRMRPAAGLFSATTGTFQGGNQAPASTTVISSVTTSDGRTVTYNYQPFNDPTLPFNFQVLAGATYEDGTQAVYTSAQIEPGTRPLITAYIDPRYDLPLARSRTQYYLGTTYNFGQVLNQLSYDTQETLQFIGIGSGGWHNPITTYANGATESYNMYLASGPYAGYPNGKENLWVDSLGRKTTYTYANNGWGYPISVTDPLGRTKTTNPSPFGNPLFITYPDNSTESWTRDNKDLVLSHSDQLGRVTTYTRDSRHRVTLITYPDGSAEGFTYNSFSQVVNHKLRNGGSESYSYDPTGRMISRTNAVGQSWTYTYDSYGRTASIKDPRNNSEYYSCDSRGHIIKITHPDGSTHSYSFDLFGNKLSDVDELGHTTSYSYDQFKRITSVIDPLGRTTTYGFRSNIVENHPDTVTMPSGKSTAFTYDLEWNLLSSTKATGTADAATTSYQHDSVNRIVSVTDPNGNVTKFTYDAMNRRLSSSDPLGHVSQWSYDLVGNLVTTTRPDEGVTRNTFDSMNHIISSVDPKGEKTTMVYDLAGNMTSETDAKGNTYQWIYDALNRKTEMVFPDHSTEKLSYDSAGNIASMSTRAGVMKSSTYDNRNRETSYSWSDGTPGVTRTYDSLSRLVSSSNGALSSAYTYDSANELLSETDTNTNLGQPWKISYSYDLDGNRTSLTYPSGLQVAYEYTNRNQVSAIGLGSQGLAEYTYDPDGNVRTKLLANGTLTSDTYDADSNLTTINHTLSGKSFARFDYGYDVMNRRTFEQRDLGKGDVYSYDAVDQVAQVSYDAAVPASSPTGADRSVSYVYDATGNRTTVNDSSSGTTSYVANDLNEYTSVGGTVYNYDGDGNLVQGNGIYLYDAQNRLLTAKVGQNLDQFTYDSRNRVVEREVNGSITYLVYDGWDLIEERGSTGGVLATYIHGVRQDELLSKNTNSGTVYYHHNALGNVSDLTDAHGAVVESYQYDVFGKVTITTGSGNILTSSAYGNRFLFTGREYLQEVNLYDFRNRVYSADLGRFLQTDPLLFDAGDVNLYRYCRNNPVNYTDGFGLCLSASNSSSTNTDDSSTTTVTNSDGTSASDSTNTNADGSYSETDSETNVDGSSESVTTNSDGGSSESTRSSGSDDSTSSDNQYSINTDNTTGEIPSSDEGPNSSGLFGDIVGGLAGAISGGLIGGEIGSAVGALVGAVTGAIAGGLAGGPVGAVAGALVGAGTGGELGADIGSAVGGIIGGYLGSDFGSSESNYITNQTR